MAGVQLSMLEGLYEDDARMNKILKGLEQLARNIRWVYGLLYSYESSQGMFTESGKIANDSIDALEDVTTALAMLVYSELSDLPIQKDTKLKDLVDKFCKLELVGIAPESPTKEALIDAAYVLPTVFFRVSDEIKSSRKEVLLQELLRFISKIEQV